MTFPVKLKSQINKLKILSIPSLVSLSPSLLLMASTNPSKSIPPLFWFSGVSSSAIKWKIVGFLVSNPRDYMADLSSFGSIIPV